MRGFWALFGGQVGDLLLVGSLVTAPPAWLGSFELLSALGIDGTLAALVSGLYVWGRIAASGAVLLRRARRGDLTLDFEGMFPGPRASLAVGHADPVVSTGPILHTSIPALADSVDEDAE